MQKKPKQNNTNSNERLAADDELGTREASLAPAKQSVLSILIGRLWRCVAGIPESDYFDFEFSCLTQAYGTMCYAVASGPNCNCACTDCGSHMPHDSFWSKIFAPKKMLC